MFLNELLRSRDNLADLGIVGQPKRFLQGAQNLHGLSSRGESIRHRQESIGIVGAAGGEML